MIALFFAVNRRIEPQGYTKENKKQDKICPQGSFFARQPRKDPATNKDFEVGFPLKETRSAKRAFKIVCLRPDSESARHHPRPCAHPKERAYL